MAPIIKRALINVVSKFIIDLICTVVSSDILFIKE